MQENRSMLPASLRAIVNAIEETRHIIKESDARIKNNDEELKKLQAELERQLYVQERLLKEIHRLRQELEALKNCPIIAASTSSVQAAMAASVKTPIESGRAAEKPAAGAVNLPAETELPASKSGKPNAPNLEYNIPIMKGSGFSQITVDYLKKMSKSGT